MQTIQNFPTRSRLTKKNWLKLFFLNQLLKSDGEESLWYRTHRILFLLHDDFGIYTFQFTFPDGPNVPSKIEQSFPFRSIPFHISLKLRFPVIDIRFRHRGVAIWAPMPKAPMDEYRNFPPGITDVGPTYVSPFRVINPPMNPVSRETRTSEHASNSQLRLRIPASIALHRLPHSRRRSRWRYATHVNPTWNMHITISNEIRPPLSCTCRPSNWLWLTTPWLQRF